MANFLVWYCGNMMVSSWIRVSLCGPLARKNKPSAYIKIKEPRSCSLVFTEKVAFPRYQWLAHNCNVDNRQAAVDCQNGLADNIIDFFKLSTTARPQAVILFFLLFFSVIKHGRSDSYHFSKSYTFCHWQTRRSQIPLLFHWWSASPSL